MERALQFALHISLPNIGSDVDGTLVDVVAFEILADAFDVAGEEGESAGVVEGVDGLWEVDEDDLILPIEDVKGRQVTVNAVAGHEGFDVLDAAVKERAGFFGCEANFLEEGSCCLLVANVFHEEAVAREFKGLGHVGSGVKEFLHGAEFVFQPSAVFDRFARACFFLEGTELAFVAGDVAALLVDRIVFHGTVATGTIDFGRDKVDTEAGCCFATVDLGFFSPFDTV